MLRSALISAFSAFLAVCTTLLYQQWLDPNSHQHVPSAAVSTAEITLQQQQQEQQQADQQQHNQLQDQDSSNTDPPPSPAPIDLAQALGLGRVLLSRGEQEEAALVYRVAASAAVAAHDGDVGTNREGGEAQHGLGLALLAAGRSEEALEACREAERLDSLSAVASSCVGVLLTGAGDSAGAVEALRRAVDKAVAVPARGEADVGRIDAMRGRLGGALLDAGEVDEAISVMMMSGGSNSGDPHVAYNLGVAWQTKVCLQQHSSKSLPVPCCHTYHKYIYKLCWSCTERDRGAEMPPPPIYRVTAVSETARGTTAVTATYQTHPSMQVFVTTAVAHIYNSLRYVDAI